jgi:hypothetical protein
MLSFVIAATIAHFGSFRWEIGYVSRGNTFALVFCPAGLFVARYTFGPRDEGDVVMPSRWIGGPQTTVIRWWPGFRFDDTNLGGNLPLWPFILVAIPIIAARFYRDRRVPPGRCPNCRYDLTGNVSGRCPECGNVCSINGTGQSVER